MVRWRRTPAIFAGLAGGAVWGVPVLAGAATLDGAREEVLVTLNDLLASPVAYFFIGLAAGAAVTGVVAGVAGHRSRKRLRLELDRVIAERDLLRANATPTVIHISSPGVVLEPPSVGEEADALPQVTAPQGPSAHAGEGLGSTAGLGRSGSPAAEAPVPEGEGAPQATEPVFPVPEEASDLDEPDAEDGPSVAGAGAGDAMLPDAVLVPEPRPNAPAHEALGKARPARVRARLDDTLPRLDDVLGASGGAGRPMPSFPDSNTFRLAQAPGQEGAAPSARPVPPASRPRAGEDSVGDAPATAGVAGAPAARPARANAGEDYERVAEDYVRSSKASERERSRSRGVRAILGERLRGNVMDGLPVIERADGSTADIGTSWWTREVGSTHSFAPLDPSTTANIPPVTAAPDPMSTAALRAGEIARAQRDARAAGLSSADDTADLGATTRAAAIAQRLSSVDMSLYPEEHETQAEAGGDMFEQAMRALDDQDPAPVPQAAPDEQPAAPAQLSEDLKTGAVVTPQSLAEAGRDKEAEDYVDYLVRDEMERNRARRSQRPVLTVFEGTGDLTDAGTGRGGKHFAKPQGHDGGGRTRGEA